MAERNLGDDVRLECRLRLEALQQGAGPCLACNHPDSIRLYTPSPSGIGEGNEVSVDALIGCARLDGSVSRAWVVGAEEGRGHNALARHFAHIWCSGHSSILPLQAYQGLMAFNSEQVSRGGCWEAVKDFLPDTVTRWGAPDFAEWMEENRVLIIIEDFDYRKCKVHIEETLEEWGDTDFLILTSPSYVAVSASLFSEHLPTLKFSIVNMEISTILNIAGDILSAAQKKAFEKWCEENWSIASEILMYPDLIQPICYAWSSGYISASTITATQLLWNVLEGYIAQNMYMELSAIEKWYLAIGQLARASLEDRNRKPIEREDVMNKAQEIFPSGFAEELTVSSLPCLFSWLSKANIYYPHPVKQFLAAWDVLHQNLNGVRLKVLTKYLIDEDSVVIYAAGHLVRILEFQPQSPDKNITRCAKHLILHMDRAKNRFVYTLRVVNEFLAHPWILDAFKAEVEYPKHWEIHDKGMLVPPVEALLQFSGPNKILLLKNQKREAPDLEGLVRLLAKNTIPLSLIESSHLEWESPSTTDDLVRIIQKGTAELQDLIGSLTCETIRSLGDFKTTCHLVCLRIRVTTLDAVQALLDCPRHLPSLMWLEPDFDLPLVDLEKVQLLEVNTSLMDVCFKDICDEDVPLLCGLLATIRKNYAGLHLLRSTLTPQGVIDILKQFYKSGTKMAADIKAINRYRRWRYPVLSSIDPPEELKQEKVQHLLGYDDRHHYNDNEVQSSALTNPKEALALSEFLKLMDGLLCFRYTCSNYIVIKHCNGNVEAKKLL